jgi:hypothetical protein
MALVKWDLSIGLLEAGYDVLLLDPDLVLLRNPLPYFVREAVVGWGCNCVGWRCGAWAVRLRLAQSLTPVTHPHSPASLPFRFPLPLPHPHTQETIGVCDISIQLDSLIDPEGTNVIRQGGYSFHEEGFDNFYNTGGILMRASARTLAWVRRYHAFAVGQYAAGTNYDDQALFNRFILWQHELRLPPKYAGLPGHNATGQYAFDQVMANDCLHYRTKDDAAGRPDSAPDAVSVYPLNPHMFLPRPGVQDLHLPTRIMHRPYWVSAGRGRGLASWSAEVSVAGTRSEVLAARSRTLARATQHVPSAAPAVARQLGDDGRGQAARDQGGGRVAA